MGQTAVLLWRPCCVALLYIQNTYELRAADHHRWF